MAKEKMIMWLVGMVLERLDSEDVRRWIKAGVTMLRQKVIESPNKYDDMVVLPILDVVEEVVEK